MSKKKSDFMGFQPLKPLAQEDSPGPGYWDAKTRGNKRGRSFFVDSKGKVTYVTDAALQRIRRNKRAV